MSWYYCIYSPELKDAKDAYRQTPNWSGEILQEFEKTLQDAWSIKDFPDMIIPRESVRDLRGAIIKGLHELREALITEKDKAPVPGQPHPCTVTVVSISRGSSSNHFCSSPLTPVFCTPQELWQRRLEHRIVRLRLREHQVSRCEGSRSLERRDHVAVSQRAVVPSFCRLAWLIDLGVSARTGGISRRADEAVGSSRERDPVAMA